MADKHATDLEKTLARIKGLRLAIAGCREPVPGAKLTDDLATLALDLAGELASSRTWCDTLAQAIGVIVTNQDRSRSQIATALALALNAETAPGDRAWDAAREYCEMVRCNSRR